MATTDADAAARGANRPLDPRLLRYSSASRSFLAVSAVIVLGQTAIIAGFAWTLTRALVGAIDGAPVATLAPWIAGAVVLAVLRGALIAAGERNSARGAARASLQLRSALVAAIERLGPARLGGRSAASLAVTAGHGLESLDAYFGRYLPQLVATVITTPLLVLAILVSDPVSGLVVIVTLPLIPVFMVLIGLATRAVQRRQYATLGRLAARFADTVGGLGTLKIYGRQHRAAESIETVTHEYKRETMTVLRVSFLSGFALEFLASLSVAVVAVTIGFRLLDGSLSLTIGLFVLLLAPEAYLPVRQVGVQFHAAAEGVAATDDIFEVLDAARDVPATAPPQHRLRLHGTGPAGDLPEDGGQPEHVPATGPLLLVRGLRVARGDRVVGPVDLAVSPGAIVLLEGPSGAGKSSMLAALLGFAPYEGEILLDGMPAADARGAIAWAGQQPGLMSGSVAENVALGDADPDAALVSACLAAAQASDVDPTLELGAMGAGLSGGQAQRVAVARALYRLRSGRARILALDEPSSALDGATEAGLWAALRAEADAGAGILLVSHRASARTIADRVLSLLPATVAP